MNDGAITAPTRFVKASRREPTTALSGPLRCRPIILVLGMHRSGTSLCSHILSALGVDMADDIGAAASNPGGHWERWEIVDFHDRILGLFNREYAGRFHDFALPLAWWADPRVAEIRREVVGFLERKMGDGYFGFKDPRTVRLMPMWHQIFSELNLSPKVVLCLRNPAQVARSLSVRDGLDPGIGEYRWFIYIVDFFRYLNSFDFCIVEYEDWFKDRSANFNKLQQFLDLKWYQTEADRDLMLSGLIDPAARHDDPKYCEANQPLVRSLHKLARCAGHDDAARDQIASIVSQFVAFQQVQRPFLRDFEEIARTAAKYAEIEQELTTSRAIAASAERRANAAEARLTEAMAEIERRRQQITEQVIALRAFVVMLLEMTAMWSVSMGCALAVAFPLEETLIEASDELVCSLLP
jgi:hypothetical protein